MISSCIFTVLIINSRSWGGCVLFLSRFIEMLIDYCLVIASLIVFIVAACAVETPVRAKQYAWPNDFTLYLSLNSYVQTAASRVRKVVA